MTHRSRTGSAHSLQHYEQVRDTRRAYTDLTTTSPRRAAA